MNKTILDHYYYDPKSYEENVIDGVKVYRTDRMLAGCWMPVPSPIDRLLGHVQISVNCFPLNELLRKTNIAWSSVSRCRSGVFITIPDLWFARLAEFSGIPEETLYAIAGQKKEVSIV